MRSGRLRWQTEKKTQVVSKDEMPLTRGEYGIDMILRHCGPNLGEPVTGEAPKTERVEPRKRYRNWHQGLRMDGVDGRRWL
jgi:hypothetical protein